MLGAISRDFEGRFDICLLAAQANELDLITFALCRHHDDFSWACSCD
jgi:hypothetical protein